MASKPQTYAQQVQELKNQIEQKDTLITELQQNLSLMDELKAELTRLKDQVSLQSQAGQQSAVASKAQQNDLLQRAQSAEQGIKNLQFQNQALVQERDAVQQQLDLLGHELLKHKGKNDKLTMMSEELKTSNLRVASLNQRVRDLEKELSDKDSAFTRRVRDLQNLADWREKRLLELQDAIQNLPNNALADLRRLAGLS